MAELELKDVKPRPMSNQKAFNNVWRHFIIEKHPIAKNSDGGNCMYRGVLNDTVVGCAIGCQIPNDFPDLARITSDNPEINVIIPGNTSYTSLSKDTIAAIADYFRNVDSRLLVKLQSAHDAYGPQDIKFFEARLRNVASEFGLEIPDA